MKNFEISRKIRNYDFVKNHTFTMNLIAIGRVSYNRNNERFESKF